MLFVITERVKTAEKYRNAFEIVKQRVVDQIAKKGQQPRQAIGGLTSDLKSTFNDLQASDDGYQHEQFNQIVSDMAGERGPSKGGIPAPAIVASQAPPVPDMSAQQPQPQPQQQHQQHHQQHHQQQQQQHHHYGPHSIPPHMQQPQQQQVHPSYQQYSGFETENMPALGMPPVEYLPNGLDMSNGGLPMENYIPMNNDGFDPRMI